MAVEPGHVEVVRALLAAGASLAAGGPHAKTVLTTALDCTLGFAESSLATARVLAGAMDEGAVKDTLRRRLERASRPTFWRSAIRPGRPLTKWCPKCRRSESMYWRATSAPC